MYQFSDKVLTLQPSAIRELFKLMVGEGIIAFSGGNPAKEAFPIVEIEKITHDILKNEPVSALQYAISEGYAPLRNQIADAMKDELKLTAEDMVLITSGAQQANDLAVKVFCNEGDAIACEETCFIGSLNAFKSNNVNIESIAMDDHGMLPNALEKAIQDNDRIKLIYLIPNFQNPTGITMPLERRKAIYEIAKKYGRMILEDDPYGRLRFKGEAVPSIKSMDTEGLVCYSGSFSKVVAPGLRVGYMIANERIVDRATLLKQFTDVHTNILAQIIVYEFYKQYDVDAHIKRISELYFEKYELMYQMILKYFPKEITCNEVDGGMFIWCRDITETLDIESFVKMLVTKHKVAIISGNVFSGNGKASHAFRLNFTVPSPAEIERGIEVLGRELKNVLGQC